MTRAWTPHEITILRQYPATPLYVIADKLNRTPLSCYLKAYAIGIRSTKRSEYGPEFEAFLREKNAEGWTDAEIADDWHGTRVHVGWLRRKLGLPSNAFSERQRERGRAHVQRVCEQNDVRCLGELGVVANRQRAHAAGWPEDCTPAMCAILDLLEAGPKTAQEIRDALARRVKTTGATTKNAGSSARAALLRLGLVVVRERRSYVSVYALAPGFARRQNVTLSRAEALEAA